MDDITKDIYHTTTNQIDGEVKRKWASGPYTEKELTAILGHDLWTASRRFGIKQGKKLLLDGSEVDKIRQIDDHSEFFGNACVTTDEKVTVDGIDCIANVAKLWDETTLKGRKHPWKTIKLTLSDGRLLAGTLHP